MQDALVAAIIAIGLPLGGLLALRSPRLMALLLMVTSEIGEALLEYRPAVRLAEFNIYPNDIVASLLLMAFVLRVALQHRRWFDELANRLLLGFAALVTISLIRGILLYGQSAVNEARPYVYFVSAALFFSAFQFDRRDYVSFLRLFVLTGLWVAGLSFLRSFSLISEPVQRSFDDFVNLRASWLGGYLATTITVVFALLLLRAHRLWRATLQPVVIISGCVVSIVILQERTMWIAAITAGGMYLLKYHLRGTDILLGSFGLISLATVSGGVFVPAALERLLVSLRTAVVEPTMAGGNTAAWRVEGWKYLLDNSTVQGLLTGAPFGSGFVRLVGGTVLTVSPHNFYIQSALRVGIPGFVLLLTIYATVLTRMFHVRSITTDKVRTVWLDSIVLAVVIELIVDLAWGVLPSYGMVLGIALSAASGARPQARSSRPAHDVRAIPAHSTHGMVVAKTPALNSTGPTHVRALDPIPTAG